jgi:hypothetical protein
MTANLECEPFVDAEAVGDFLQLRPQLSLSAFDSEVMGHAISFPCASIAGQREDRRLSKEVHGGSVLVQIGADGEPIRGFIWGDADLFAHEFVLLSHSARAITRESLLAQETPQFRICHTRGRRRST